MKLQVDDYTNPEFRVGRPSARAIIINDGSLLMIERNRPGLHYFSTPGGGIEDGETTLEAVQREIIEETSLNVRVEREIYRWVEGTHTHHFFLATYISGEPKLSDDAEENNNDPDNTHDPLWINLESIKDTPFGYWEPIKAQLMHDIQHGFPESVKLIEA